MPTSTRIASQPCSREQAAPLRTLAPRQRATRPRRAVAALTMLAHDSSPEARIAYAANDRADPVILAWLAHDPYRAVRITLAGRSRLARSILTVLARDADAGVREVIAVRPRLPRSVLEHLLGDAYLGVRIGAAMFHRLSPEYLAWCATNPAPAWRQVAAVAPRLNQRLQRRLATDPCWDVRRLVPLAKRSNQPLEVAVVMALAPELADDALVAECLAAQIDAYVATHSLTNVPHDAISRFLRSPHAAIRASGRRLAHAAYRARTGTVGTAATDIAA